MLFWAALLDIGPQSGSDHMKQENFWPRLEKAFGNQKAFWAQEELAESPQVMDRVIHYLIAYFDNAATARKAVRIFRGIESESGVSFFSSWNEVRVSSLREIREALDRAGCSIDTWELALTIKDFLTNTWYTLDTLDLHDVSHVDSFILSQYLDQLRSVPGSWFIEGEREKRIVVSTPFRPESQFYKHFKCYRGLTEPVLPSCAIDFLEYSWNRTQLAPFENHANRIMSRLGLFASQDPIATKLIQFEEFTTAHKPVAKHKHLVQLGKVVCFAKNPRCGICPVSAQCKKIGVN